MGLNYGLFFTCACGNKNCLNTFVEGGKSFMLQFEAPTEEEKKRVERGGLPPADNYVIVCGKCGKESVFGLEERNGMEKDKTEYIQAP